MQYDEQIKSDYVVDHTLVSETKLKVKKKKKKKLKNRMHFLKNKHLQNKHGTTQECDTLDTHNKYEQNTVL